MKNTKPRPPPVNISTEKAQFSLQDDEMRKGAAMWAGIFVGIGVATFLASLVQQACFALMGAKLSRRVRGLTFAALMRQVSTFLRPPCRSSAALPNVRRTGAVLVCWSPAAARCWLPEAACAFVAVRQRGPKPIVRSRLCRRSWHGSTRKNTPAAPSLPVWPPTPPQFAAPWCAL